LAVISRVLVDTGPLVAILSDHDAHHDACTQQLRSIRAPLLTCWPVLTEAAWLLRNNPDAVDDLIRSIGSGFLHVLDIQPTECGAIADIMDRYRDLPAQLADAMLMHLAQREQTDVIFTLDRRDFTVYRLPNGRPVRIIPDPNE
jgi:hypothetical protein